MTFIIEFGVTYPAKINIDVMRENLLVAILIRAVLSITVSML